MRVDALIKDIEMDKLVSLNSVDRKVYLEFKENEFFKRQSNLGPIDLSLLERKVKPVETEGEKL